MVRSRTRRNGLAWIGFAAAVVWGIAACSEPAPSDQAEDTTPQPGVSDVVLASAMVGLPAGTAPADLPDPESEGATILTKYCATACHGAPSPGAHSATDWPVVLRRMWLRTEGLSTTYGVPVPDVRERVLILNYVLGNALEVSNTALPARPGRELFTSTCSRCHELPDPRQHTANDWAAVVIRMRQHMVQMLRQSPPQSQVQEIILYLEQVSRGAS
ncbi:MAG: hypothetical protein OEO20_08025 [Gemmatimonadota bacterium]|nr:hypothetical protein [Gemmatimonadota bacterium]MDH3368943.1 hypothetical protein [Gemmatimonadota bacterium]MDH3478237.1 hypothetical protein [Gemmatimonadota bacterium]MDH5550623.1 hypothetical protein [Gemmatimonadota bacterium]